MVDQSFLLALPKVELHVHQVGSASIETVAQLVGRHPGGPVPTDAAALADYFTFRDFAHFIDLYLSVVDLVQDADDVHLLTTQVARDLAAQQVRYAELTCTPYTSVIRGVPIEGFVEAIEDARRAAERDLGIVLRWIFDIPGESGLRAADATLSYALDQRPDGLVGFGLGGPEIGVPRNWFAPHFTAARAAGLHCVPHAGESTGPETIWSALHDLGAERIGHGTSCADDPALLAYLALHRIPVEVSLTSNLATGVVRSLAQHPVLAMRDAGVVVTINSDDPPMFGTTLTREYGVAADLLGLDERGVAALVRTALDVSYAPCDVRTRVAAELTAYEEAALG